MKQRRFIKSIIETAKANEGTRMPWERGAPRAAMIANRKSAEPTLKRA
ncbi:hypothetical protein [Sagittula stellata]|uniref:Uncharacterized protein n=1 Tax=Sagittula stellata (strain ATCC 700073 / DSM 11524 / E-37) TaxID=388399 RepID=A3KB83_SAGS3|nr:hypothetical protein [Sagittula stellata]EBA05555.1 hypothetical protein SSE37_14389 [Sagittula stellata E-37]